MQNKSAKKATLSSTTRCNTVDFCLRNLKPMLIQEPVPTMTADSRKPDAKEAKTTTPPRQQEIRGPVTVGSAPPAGQPPRSILLNGGSRGVGHVPTPARSPAPYGSNSADVPPQFDDPAGPQRCYEDIMSALPDVKLPSAGEDPYVFAKNRDDMQSNPQYQAKMANMNGAQNGLFKIQVNPMCQPRDAQGRPRKVMEVRASNRASQVSESLAGGPPAGVDLKMTPIDQLKKKI